MSRGYAPTRPALPGGGVYPQPGGDFVELLPQYLEVLPVAQCSLKAWLLLDQADPDLFAASCQVGFRRWGLTGSANDTGSMAP